MLLDAEADEAAELAWTTERLQQIGAAVAAAAAAAGAGAAGAPSATEPAVNGGGHAAAADDAAAAALNQLEAAAAAVAGQLTRLVYQASTDPSVSAATASGAAANGQIAAAATAAPVSALYPTITPRQQAADLGFNPTNLGGVFEGLDLNLLGLSHLAGGMTNRRPGQPQQQPSSAEDCQLVLGVERIRVPELLYQPAALAGVDQAGLGEVLSLVFQRLPKQIGDAVAGGGVVLTGGNACFPGGWCVAAFIC